jgi:hypothetical protein
MARRRGDWSTPSVLYLVSQTGNFTATTWLDDSDPDILYEVNNSTYHPQVSKEPL